jgi:hypothetical protein
MKTTIGLESSSNLNSHSTGSADGELWLWGPQTNSYGHKEWGINEGRYGCAYSIRSFNSRKEAVAELRKLRNDRAEQAETRKMEQAEQNKILETL